MAKTLRFWLPADLKRFVDEQARAGGYISGPEFVRDLIRQHRHRKASETAALPAQFRK